MALGAAKNFPREIMLRSSSRPAATAMAAINASIVKAGLWTYGGATSNKLRTSGRETFAFCILYG